MKQDILKKRLVVISSKRKYEDELNEISRNGVVTDFLLAVLQEVDTLYIPVDIEWAFIQQKLPNVLQDYDRLEVSSLIESDGGEECEAIITSLRRAKRRALRRSNKLLEGSEMVIEERGIQNDEERALTGGKTLPTLRLTLNGN
jgi:uncharacterized SAM-dependent methyltransferase